MSKVKKMQKVQDDYRQSERFNNELKELEKETTLKLDAVVLDISKNWFIEVSDIWVGNTEVQEKIFKSAFKSSQLKPGIREFNGEDLRLTSDFVKKMFSEGQIPYFYLSIAISFISSAIPRMDFEIEHHYCEMLELVFDPANKYCTEQYELIMEKIKEEKELLMDSHKVAAKVLQDADILRHNQQKK